MTFAYENCLSFRILEGVAKGVAYAAVGWATRPPLCFSRYFVKNKATFAPKMAFHRMLAMVGDSPAKRRATCCPPIRFFLVQPPHFEGVAQTDNTHPRHSRTPLAGIQCLLFAQRYVSLACFAQEDGTGAEKYHQ